MLQNIRENVQGTMAKIIVALIAVPFALFGVEAFFTGGEPSVAEVAGEQITERELARAIELERRRLLGQSEGEIDPTTLDEESLRGPALEALIERKVLQTEADDASLLISDSLINQLIIEDPNFQENGVFSQARFQGLLASNGFSPEMYRDLLRQDLQISQLISGVGDSEFVTEGELQDLSRLSQQSVKLRYMTVPVDSLSAELTLSDEEVEDYYAEHADDFMTQEQVSVNYLELSIDMLAPEVSEEQMQAEYERRIEAMPPAIERHAAHIMLTSLDDDEAQAKLQSLKLELAGGANFAELAEAHSEDPGSASEGGDLGYTTGDAFPEEFEEALAALEPGAVSDPVQTESGWHLIKLLDMREMERPEFEELRLEIQAALQREAAEPLFVQQSEELADLTFNSENLQEAAEALGLVVQTTDVFGRDGGQGVFAEPAVIRAAFSADVLERDMNSELVELGGEHVIVLHKSEYLPARTRELAEVRPQIEVVLRESRIREMARDRAASLLSAAEAGETIENLAIENGYEWQLINQHRRGADGIPLELSDAAFALKRSGNDLDSSTVSLANGDAVVFQVSEFRQGPTSSIPDQQRNALARIIQQGRGRAMAVEYQGLLRERADVKLL